MNITSILYELSLDESWLDDQFGDIESYYGWNGLIIGKRYTFWINVNSQGVKTVEAFCINERSEVLERWRKDQINYNEALEY